MHDFDNMMTPRFQLSLCVLRKKRLIEMGNTLINANANEKNSNFHNQFKTLKQKMIIKSS